MSAVCSAAAIAGRAVEAEAAHAAEAVLNVFSISAPKECKPKPERKGLYELSQREVNNIPSKQQILILGDLNARVRNDEIHGIKQCFNETKYNSNGELLVQFSTNDSLRIFDHKPQYKYT